MTAAPHPRDFVLPYPPRGMRRPEAAAYVGVSPSLFDQMVNNGVMPKPRRYKSRTVIWDRLEIEEAFSCLPKDESDKPVRSLWDTMSR